MGNTIVIGGGVIGLSAAWHLARRGERVTLLEANETLKGSASCGNAGLIALGHAPMPAPKLLGRTLKMLFDPLNPLYIRPRPSVALLRWFLQFRRSCSQWHFERSMRALADLGGLVRDSFEEIIEGESIHCEYGGDGWLDVYRTPDGRTRALATAELERLYGFNVDVIEGEAFHDRWPAFSSDVLGGALRTESRTAWPDAFMAGLAEAATRLGVVVRTGTPAGELSVTHGRCRGVKLHSGERIDADRVILCAGVWTSGIAQTASVRIPMQAGKGYHLSVSNPGLTVGSVLSETYVAATPMGGRLRLAGTVELSGTNLKMHRRRLDMLLRGARSYFAALHEDTRADEWCGLRPCTADGLPVIGAAPHIDGLFIGTGHAMMGFTLGPITGKILAQLAMDEAAPVDLEPYSVARF